MIESSSGKEVEEAHSEWPADVEEPQHAEDGQDHCGDAVHPLHRDPLGDPVSHEAGLVADAVEAVVRERTELERRSVAARFDQAGGGACLSALAGA